MDGDRARRGWALALFAVLVAADLGYVLVAGDAPAAPAVDAFDPGQALGALATGALGLTLAWLRPRNAVGWLLTLAGLALVLCDVGQAYGGRALTSAPELPLGALALSLSAPLWIGSVFIPVSVLLVRYPTGTITGRWPRRFDRIAVVGFALVYVAYAGSAQSVSDEVPGRLPPVLLPESITAVLGGTGMLLLVAGTLLIVADAVRRVVRGERQERAPLLLLLSTGVTAALVILIGPNTVAGSLCYAAVLASIGVGVLRYRALGIELVVRRAVISVLLTGLVLAVFVGVTSGLAGLVPSGPGARVVAASLIAVGLMPARERLQKLVDRLLYGERDDPAGALRRLGSSMDHVPAEGLLLAVVANLADSLHLDGAEITDPAGRPLAARGEPSGRGGIVPLAFAGSDLGALRLGARRGEPAMSKADRQLLEAVVPMIAAVVHTTALTEELRTERNRVVGATQSERRRLRQELHDGLGPSLTGIGLGLEAAAAGPLARDPATAELLRRLRTAVADSLEDIHRIIEDLRPAALDGADLTTALRARTATAADEALANVVRHAHATTCTVRVTAADRVRLTIEDDGVGFDAPRPGGVGLDSMQERAGRLGGHVRVERRTPGTCVVAEVPLSSAEVTS